MMSWRRDIPMEWRLRLLAHLLAVGAFLAAGAVAMTWGERAWPIIAALMLLACAGLVWAVVLQMRHGFQRPFGDG